VPGHPAVFRQDRGCSIGRIKRHRSFEQLQGLIISFPCAGVERRQSTQVQIVGIEASGRFGACTFDLGTLQARHQRADDARRHLVLECEDVIDVALITLSPDICACIRLHQLTGDPHPVASLAHDGYTRDKGLVASRIQKNC
jgi:hypothetical protein